MKKLGVLLAILVALTGGAVSVMQYMKIGPFAEKPVEGQVDANGNAIQGVPEPSLEPPRFIDMDPLVIPVFQGDKVVTTVQIQVKVEAADADSEERLRYLLPRLNDAFLRELYAYLPRLMRKENSLNVGMIKRRLQLAAEKVAGKEAVRDILVQSVVDNPR